MEQKRPRKRDHIMDIKRITSSLMTKYKDANDAIRKKIITVDKIVTMLEHYKEISSPTFLDFQLTQLIADASHFASIVIGNRVVFPESAASSKEAPAPRSKDTTDSAIDPIIPIAYNGGPCQFTQIGCEVACTIIATFFSLLYLQHANIPFREFVDTIKWNVIMQQSAHLFRLWKDKCMEKLRKGIISSLPPFPTLDEVWHMPQLKKLVDKYILIDNSGHYKNEQEDEDDMEDIPTFPVTSFRERMKRVDDITRKRKETLVHIVTAGALTIAIISTYRPLSDSVGYVFYDSHGTYFMNKQHQQQYTHYAANFRYENYDQRAFLVEYPSLDVLLDNFASIPFCAVHENKTEISKYTFSTIARESFVF